MEEILEEARQEVNALCEISSDRIVNNMTVAITGLKCMQKFAQSFNIDMKKFSYKDLVQLCTDELCEVSGGKIAVDTLLENLAILVDEMMLVRGTHYLCDGVEFLYLRLEQCLPKLREWAKRTCCEDEILDCKAYKRMFKERLNCYVEDVGKVKQFGKSSQRVVVINLKKAEKFGLQLSGFFSH